MSIAREAENAYRVSSNLHLREELVQEHMGLVHDVLGRLMATLPQHVDREGLQGAGMLGLVQAAAAYNPEQGNFARFAQFRIRGAMLDELRRSSGLSQAMLQRIKLVDQARLQCDPPASIEEIAARAELTVEQVVETLEHARWTRLEDGLVMDEVLGKQLGGPTEAPDPQEEAMKQELHSRLTEAIEQLGEQDRLIVTLYYLESLRMAEIAEVLDIHVGNVSKRLAKIEHKLAEQLREFVEHHD
ncbi:MAG: sigma-70 family RNA polymerase sigma factor [Planctomycetales bacterium]|nr:sigma-70 family RNA polymerase sigma factor [Planctomycetales bacterium]